MGKRAKSIAGKEMQKLAAFAKALDKMTEEWLHELGEQVLEEADKLVPKASGELHDSQKVEHTKDGFKIIVDTPYAYALHEGKKQEAQKSEVDKSKVKAHKRKHKPTTTITIISNLADAPTRRDVERQGLTVTDRRTRGGASEVTLEKRNITRVRSHTKTYKKGHKPKKMPDGNWATINVNKKPKKQAWLQEAWKIVRKKQDPTTRKLLQKTLYIAP